MDQKVAEALLNGFMDGLRRKAEVELKELRYEAQTEGPDGLQAVVAFLRRIDVLDDAAASAWESASKVCPEVSQHAGGRGWCYYCGDIDEETGKPLNGPPKAGVSA